MARSYDLTSGSIPQHLLRLAAPLIMGNILQQLYNTVDAFILGRFAGDLEFAAVGVAGSVMNLFLFMITGACTGISVIFAQLYGAGERERFRREHWLSLSCGLLVTLACSGLGFLLLSPLLRLIQTPSELKTFVSVYLTIILASLPAAFLYNLYGALLRAIGRANAALMVRSTTALLRAFSWASRARRERRRRRRPFRRCCASSTCGARHRSSFLPARTAVWMESY